ncbi:hypothetical protein ABPG75_001054 [Micractinium tetrahymenae]
MAACAVAASLLLATLLARQAAAELLPPLPVAPLLAEAPWRCRGPATGEHLPSLELAALWGDPPAANHTVTLVTQLTVDRLGMLENQCTTWTLPLVAAIYVPVTGQQVLGSTASTAATVELLQGHLAAFHRRMQQEAQCQLRLALFTEEQAADSADAFHPINALRNRGLQLAVTEAVLVLDVDFIVSEELIAELAIEEGWEALARRIRAGSAVVLPAFETPFDATGAWRLEHPPEAGRAVAFQAQAGGKQAAVQSFRNGTLLVFKTAEGGTFYEPTQFKRWAQSDDFYPISYTPSYEPDMILARALHPWYDERFAGYGWDKMGLPECFFHWGGSFVVHPRGFVVHVPHERSTTFHASMSDGKKRAYQLREVYTSLRAELEAGSYLPVVSFPERCSPLPGHSLRQATMDGSNLPKMQAIQQPMPAAPL